MFLLILEREEWRVVGAGAGGVRQREREMLIICLLYTICNIWGIGGEAPTRGSGLLCKFKSMCCALIFSAQILSLYLDECAV